MKHDEVDKVLEKFFRNYIPNFEPIKIGFNLGTSSFTHLKLIKLISKVDNVDFK